MRHFAMCGLFLLACGLAYPAPAAPPITTGTLVEEMIDMHGLAEFPDPAYKTVQFSSHDHRSVTPGGPNWFANSDGFGREPIPNFEAVLVEPNDQGVGEYLLCDVQSPGAIVRVWTASNDGVIRMYLDDAQQPLFDGPANEFLHDPHIGFAEAAGVSPSLFEGTFEQQDACYLPIPFAKRCRIVWVGNIQRIHFYEVQVRCYEPDAEVVTFRPDDLKTYLSTIERVAAVLRSPQAEWPYRSKESAVSLDVTLQGGEKLEALALDGPQAIERLTLSVGAGDRDLALRQTILNVVCDDFPWGQVESPLGDFFGAAPGVNPFDSVPFTVEPDGAMTSRYVMPFARSCKILFENRGEQPVRVTGSVLPIDHEWNDETSLHFRARWRVDHDLVAEGGAGAQDLPFLLANGRGVYVGTAVMLLNPNPIPWPYGNWWGEGDEKIFVDDDVRPSTFGTGSEDYFNYSWSIPDIFLFPYCGQPRDDGPANRGFVTNHRWHILDALPFQRRLGFYMELYSHERTPGFSYARIGYHYGAPGLIDDHVTITDEDVRPLKPPANWMPAARMGGRSAVFHQAEDVLVDPQHTTLLEKDFWAGGHLLAWRPTEPGAELSFDLPVPETGLYVLRLTAARTPTSGRFSATLDGESLAFDGEDIVDLRVPYRTLSRNSSTGRMELTKGDHRLTLRYEVGDEPGLIGIDFIWVQKQ